jgi:hypothetical protein
MWEEREIFQFTFCWYTWPKTNSNLSQCCKYGQWSPQNDGELRSQSTKISVGLCERGTWNISIWSYVKCRLPLRVLDHVARGETTGWGPYSESISRPVKSGWRVPCRRTGTWKVMFGPPSSRYNPRSKENGGTNDIPCSCWTYSPTTFSISDTILWTEIDTLWMYTQAVEHVFDAQTHGETSGQSGALHCGYSQLFATAAPHISVT